MRYKRLNVEVVADIDVIRNVVTNPGAFTAWIGAGASIEAGVPTGREICEDIRRRLHAFEMPEPGTEDDWARDELAWDDPRRRYSTCVLRYATTPVQRVRYFRGLIQGVQPSFSHHALCLLMSAGIIQRTCLTTNFDKLVEIAFAQQGFSECQSIRSDREAEFWRQEEGKCYVVKLHGDYETYNIQNTLDETIYVAPPVRQIVADVVRGGGLFLIGSSGYEESVRSLLNELLTQDHGGRPMPDMGLYWSVRVEGERPARPTRAQIEESVTRSLDRGSVNDGILEILARSHRDNRPCALFPVWGAGNWLRNLVDATGNRALTGRSRRYLDHFTRLRRVFADGGLSAAAIESRLARFKPPARRLPEDLLKRSVMPKTALRATSSGASLAVRFVYGDVTSRSLMSQEEFQGLRRAVVSPEDCLISASGGAALALAHKAGLYAILNEIGKFPRVEHNDVVVTSGGELPVHYIFHAAATRLDPDGTSHIAPEDVSTSMRNALDMAARHGVGVLFTPLIGSGTEGMEPRVSLQAIATAVRETAAARPELALTVVVIAFDEAAIARAVAREILEQALGPGWTLKT